MGGWLYGGGLWGTGGRGLEINKIKSKNQKIVNISRFYYYLF